MGEGRAWRRLRADGSEFAFWERRADPTKVVFFLDGGGVCFDATTCAFVGAGSGVGGEPAYDWNVYGDDPSLDPGIFDFAHARNPFAEYSFIFVPSCTGDAYLGDVTREYSPELTVEHNGFVNGKTALGYLCRALASMWSDRQEADVTPDVRAMPEGMHSITPHIVVRGAARAAEWYASALGAEEHDRLALPSGKLLYAELWFGDSAVRVADEFPKAGVLSPQSIGGTPVVLHLFTEDVDALWKQAIDAGAEVLRPLADQFWGDRQGQLTDPFGHRWNLAQHVRDVPREEIARAAAAAFGG